MADGFLISSIELAKRCWMDNDDKKADILIFPILTNANHGIELYLKGIMWTLNKLLQLETKIEGKHNIDQMYRTIKSKIKKYGGLEKVKNFERLTFELSSYIEELTNKIRSTPKDDKMDFSRYPFSNKYENHFYVDAIGTVEIDLENFISRFEEIHRVLDEVIDWLYEELESDTGNTFD